jgi:hypothetical protein
MATAPGSPSAESDRAALLRAEGREIERLYADNPELRRQKEALVAAVAARAVDALDELDYDAELTERASHRYELYWRAVIEKDLYAQFDLADLRAEDDEVIAELDQGRLEAQEALRARDYAQRQARRLNRPSAVCLGARRRASRGRPVKRRGSRRGSATSSRGSPSEPPGESDLASAVPARGWR